MSEIPFEIISNIAKRAWKFSIVFLFYFFFALFLFLSIVISKKLYIIENLEKINSNLYSFLSYLLTTSFVAIFIYFLIWILKGESDLTIRKLRKLFYQKAINRVNEVMRYRFEFNGYNEDIKNLTTYTKCFEKDGNKHIVNLNNLKSYIVDGVDTLYFFYKINEREKIIWSIWHSGDFLAIAFAIEENLVKKDIKPILESRFNLTNAKDVVLTKRDRYFWFDVKYSVSEDFLVNNIEKEKFSRIIAHFVSVGIIAGMEILEWKKLESCLAED